MAATDLERLVVQLSADIKKYENALNKAQGQTNRRARAIETRFAKMNRTIASGYTALGAAAVKAFALIGGANGAKNLIDSATRIENALKVAGLSGKELEGVYQSLYASALKNAAPLETLVTLYGRLALVQKELGITGPELQNFTDKIAVALRVSGASAQEASGALLQLSQALGGGVVRAEEFNSIQEGALPILQAVAAGLKEAGGSVASLRKLVIDGKVTSEAFFRAFEAGAPILEQKVAGATFTLDQRLINLGTALTNAAKEFNESAKAGETFGNEIDRLSQFVANIDFDNLISQIQAVVGALNSGIDATSGFLSKLGELSGFEGIGRDIVNMLPGEGASKSYFGGGLTVTSTAGITDRINQAFEGQIQQAGEMTSEAIRKSVLGGGPATTAKGGRLPAAPSSEIKPVSLKDFKAPDDKDGKKKKERLDDYARELKQIRERTANLNAETQAQAQLNPLINDYGFAVEKARAQQELLNAAQEAGKAITPELAREIDNLSTAYALSVQESERLAEKQDEIRDRAREAMDTAKDAVRGAIDGFIEGAKAGDILVSTLKKIGDALINDVLNSIFKVNSAGGGGGGFLSGLFGLFGGGGGKGTGLNYFPPAPSIPGRATGGPVTAGQPYIVGEKRPELFVPNQSGVIIPKVPKSGGGGVSAPVSINIDARGADEAGLARLQREIASLKATLPATVVSTVRDAQKRRAI